MSQYWYIGCELIITGPCWSKANGVQQVVPCNVRVKKGRHQIRVTKCLRCYNVQYTQLKESSLDQRNVIHWLIITKEVRGESAVAEPSRRKVAFEEILSVG